MVQVNYQINMSQSILRSLLQGRQESRVSRFIPTPESSVTSSSCSPRACCGTWWQPGQHLEHHISTHHQHKPVESDDIISTSSIDLDPSLTSPISSSTESLHHLITDENGISSTSDGY